MKKVLFLCTGNYYRSRYAEEIFNHLAESKGLPWRAFSRGAAERGSPDNVGPMSRFVVQALEAQAIAPAEGMRAPMPCVPTDFHDAHFVIALKEAEHRPLIEQRFPEVAGRVTYWNVDDIELAPPSIALAMIDAHVRELIAALARTPG